MSMFSRPLIAGMLALASVGIAHAQEAVTLSARQIIPARKQRGALYVSAWNYPSGPGWTVAKVKRMAKKRRNQIRHRRNCRKGR